MIKKYVKKEVDKAIKHIWLHQMCDEYGYGYFLLERSIQCSFYHHLRNALQPLLDEHNLYIYPELYFKDLGYYADIAIVEMDMSIESCQLADRLTDIAAIIEIKYGGSADYIKTDIPKMKTYIQNLDYDCQYYFVSIDEKSTRSRLNWIDGRSINNWANGRFTELNAGWIDDTMYFEINSYNRMNIQNKSAICYFEW